MLTPALVDRFTSEYSLENAASVQPDGFNFDPARYEADYRGFKGDAVFPDRQAASTAAYERQYKEWYESPERMVKELEKAGINPLYAVLGNGFSGQSASSVSGSANKSGPAVIAAIFAAFLRLIGTLATAP